MKNTILLLLLLMPWTYIRSQVVYSDYSDPDVCEGMDEDYWLTASSFQCSPGLPILHSKDLRHWTLVNYAIDNLIPLDHYSNVQHGNGVWAPSIRRHDGVYYIYWGDPDFGVFMVKTTDPRGKWSEPVLIMEGKGVIDTCPLWDDDGRCYLVNGWANSRCGFNSVLTVRELSADGTRVIGKPIMVYDGLTEGNHTIEGPKFYKHDGYYYILAPAGGVAQGWQLALRSKNVFGPYESKIVFNNKGIHQGGMVMSPNTSDANRKAQFVCFQEVGAYGRILHLLDVEWKSGWPMMSISRENKADSKAANLVYGIDGKGYGHGAYQWHANYNDLFGFCSYNGTRIYSHNVTADFRNLWEVPNLYLKKFDAECFTDTLRISVTLKQEGQQAGFVVMGRDYCRLSLELENNNFVLKRIVCKDADKQGNETSTRIASFPVRKYNAGAKTNYECKISFVIKCDKGGVCTFEYSLDGVKFNNISIPFQAREGKWIGAKYGVFSITPHNASRGWVDLLN